MSICKLEKKSIDSNLGSLAIPVVEFLREGDKIRKSVLAKNQLYSKIKLSNFQNWSIGKSKVGHNLKKKLFKN